LSVGCVISGFSVLGKDFYEFAKILAFNSFSRLIIVCMQFSPTETLDAFRRLCHQKGIAATHQRQRVYQCAINSKDHPTPELIYKRVHEEFPFISLATVYKCLHTFIDVGLLKPASLHHGSLRVDPNLLRHHHLVCKICGSMTDVAENQVVQPRFAGKLPRGFQMETIAVECIGTCADCQSQVR
jgi:Fur family peroxide stress response transcriptional regulator